MNETVGDFFARDSAEILKDISAVAASEAAYRRGFAQAAYVAWRIVSKSRDLVDAESQRKIVEANEVDGYVLDAGAARRVAADALEKIRSREVARRSIHPTSPEGPSS